MPGIGGALDIARWSLYSSQLAIEVTSHNIANANTEGYSKQSLLVEPNYPITMGPGQIGTGVRATEVTRAYDEFINKQLNIKNSEYYYWSAQSDAMEEIEVIFNESDGYGLNYLMGEFWNAWSDLSNNPDGIPEREALIAQSDNLVQAIQDIDYNLRSYQRNLDRNIDGSVEYVNSLTSQIAELNGTISSVEIDGMINANDLRDRRDLLLEELSEYMDINYYEEEQSGQVMVYILGGTPLVLGNESYELSVGNNATTGYTDVFWNDQSGRQVDITHRLEGGKIAGWVEVRDTRIGDYLDSLNTLTEELVWQVNSLHAEGVGLQAVSSLSGTVDVGLADDIGALTFGSHFNASGSFDIVVFDADGQVASTYTIDPAGSTVQALRDEINAEAAAGGGEISAALSGGTDGYFTLQANAGYTLAIQPTSDAAGSSHALAVLGVNTFFSWDSSLGDLSETVGINAALVSDPQRICAGYLDSNNAVAPGDNSVASAIFGLQDTVVTMDGTRTTMDAFFSAFVSEVGVHTQNAKMNAQFNDTLLGQYLSRKESVSGVNLDEEMANLLKNQYLYQASAKLISIADEMLQTLLSVK